MYVHMHMNALLKIRIYNPKGILETNMFNEYMKNMILTLL